MKYSSLIAAFVIIFFSANIYAGSRPDIDTVSIIGITPGTDGKIVGTHVSEKIDTLLWNQDGTGIVKFPGYYLNTKGDFRIAYAQGDVSQINFVAPTHNKEETIKVYNLLSQELVGVYGVADVETNNSIHEMRWEGMKQSISVKAEDGSNYVTIALSKFVKEFGR
jgi:hypothetical protein